MAGKSTSTTTSTAHHPVVELLDRTGEGTKSIRDAFEKGEKALKYGGKAMQVSSLPFAFRKYSWLHLAPLMNASGDLRGIVVNARARIVYDVAVDMGKIGEKVGKYAKFVGGFSALALSLHSVYDESVAIVHSNDDTGTKGGKLGAQLSSFGLRTIAGVAVIPETHLILHGISMIAGCAQSLSPKHAEGFSFIKEIASQSDADLDAKVKNFTDGNNIYHYLQIIIQPVIDRAMGFSS